MKASVAPKKHLGIPLADAAAYEVGQEIRADIFAEGDLVDVTADPGQGLPVPLNAMADAGPCPRSHYHRGPGSLGSIDAARVFKGRPLPGRMAVTGDCPKTAGC